MHTHLLAKTALTATALAAIPLAAEPLEVTGINAIKHFEVPVHRSMAGISVTTPLATHRGFNDAANAGDIYLTVISPQETGDATNNAKARLYRYDTAGSLTSAVYDASVDFTNTHHQPSLGLDQDGRVHLAVGQHNGSDNRARWNHYRSHAVGDLSQGFRWSNHANGNPDASYGLDNFRPTYAVMQQLSTGELVMTNRQEIDRNNFASRPGGTGLGMQVYNTTTGDWVMKGNHVEALPTTGERVFASNWNTKTIAYTPYAARDEFNFGTNQDDPAFWYQSWRSSTSTDADGRIHVAFPVYDGRRFPYASHVGYMVSDDGGQTFKTADGTVITDPLTLKTGINGPFNPEFGFVAESVGLRSFNGTYDPTAGLLATVHVSSLPDGTPIVGAIYARGGSFNANDQEHRLYIYDKDANSWIEQQPLSSSDWLLQKNANYIALLDGSIAFVYDDSIHRSTDLGLTWEHFEIPGLDHDIQQVQMMWDRSYSLDNLGVRFVTTGGDNGTGDNIAQVWTVDFEAIPEPTTLSLLAMSIFVVIRRQQRDA
ncbi:MAG: BNR-4 repeat-containing protein [Planctomycetota bacterium]